MQKQRSFGQFSYIVITLVILSTLSHGHSFTQSITINPTSQNSSIIVSNRYVCSHDLINNYFIGLSYSQGEVRTMWNAKEKHIMNMTSSDLIHLAFNRGSCAQVRESAISMKYGDFHSLTFPMFGYSKPLTNTIKIVLAHPSLKIKSSFFSNTGDKIILQKEDNEVTLKENKS